MRWPRCARCAGSASPDLPLLFLLLPPNNYPCSYKALRSGHGRRTLAAAGRGPAPACPACAPSASSPPPSCSPRAASPSPVRSSGLPPPAWAAQPGRNASQAASFPCPWPRWPIVHQAVEFGNRLITFLVVLTAALAVLAVVRARRRQEVVVYACLMPASTVLQAVLGGITVLTGLLWWTVAIDSFGRPWRWSGCRCCCSSRSASRTTGVGPRCGGAEPAAPVDRPLPGMALAVVFSSPARMVTGAGPHAGDKSIEGPPVSRLRARHRHPRLSTLVATGHGLPVPC